MRTYEPRGANKNKTKQNQTNPNRLPDVFVEEISERSKPESLNGIPTYESSNRRL